MQIKARRALALIIPILALVAAAGIWLGIASCGKSKSPVAPPEPDIPISLLTPAPSSLPTPLAATVPPNPDATAPAMYQLPLVPVWDEGDTMPEGYPEPTATPQREIRFEPMMGVYTETCKDFLAVGMENGIATAILLVRLEGGDMTILSLPAKTLGTVYTLDGQGQIANITRTEIGYALRLGGSNSNQSMWNLAWAVKNLIEVRAPQYIGLDLSCLEELLRVMDGVQGDSAYYTAENYYTLLHGENGMRPDAAADFAAGVIRKMRSVSIWELPGVQRATKGKVCSSLSVRQLIALGKALKNITEIRWELLPTFENGNTRVLDAEASYLLLKNLYK